MNATDPDDAVKEVRTSEMATVRDVMTTALLTVEATAALTEAAAQMDARRVGAALVHLDRARQARNFLATVLLSQGCPMISHGDEVARTQDGNNNAYCQDSELTWVDWANADTELLDWTRRLIRFRREQPVLHRQKFFFGAVGRGHRRQDLVWLRSDGQEMKDPNWRNRSLLSIGMLLNGDMIPDRSERGEPIRGDTLLLLFHAHHEPLDWRLPGEEWGGEWEILADSAIPGETPGARRCRAGGVLRLVPRSVVVLKRT